MIGTWWQHFMLVALGGALGACGRFVVGDWMRRATGDGFPWGTLMVNLMGCFVAGIVLVWLESRGSAMLLWRAFLLIGVLGGLTTWSSLIVEMALLNRSGGPGWSAVYLGLSLAGSLGLLWAGLRLGGSLLRT